MFNSNVLSNQKLAIPIQMRTCAHRVSRYNNGSEIWKQAASYLIIYWKRLHPPCSYPYRPTPIVWSQKPPSGFIANNGATNLQNACAMICYWFSIAENCTCNTAHVLYGQKGDKNYEILSERSISIAFKLSQFNVCAKLAPFVLFTETNLK